MQAYRPSDRPKYLHHSNWVSLSKVAQIGIFTSVAILFSAITFLERSREVGMRNERTLLEDEKSWAGELLALPDISLSP